MQIYSPIFVVLPFNILELERSRRPMEVLRDITTRLLDYIGDIPYLFIVEFSHFFSDQ